MPGFKTGRSAHVFCHAHGFMRNVREGVYVLGSTLGDPCDQRPPLLMRAWTEVRARLLASYQGMSPRVPQLAPPPCSS